jgi:hypothetical protein
MLDFGLMRWSWLGAFFLGVACSGKSANDASSSNGGAESGGAAGSSTGGTAGTQGGSGGTSGSSGASGATSGTGGTGGTESSGGSGGAAGTGASAGDAGANGGFAGDGGSAGVAAAGGDDGTGPCADVTTRDECDARSDCHSVFFDPQNCPCAALGCCAQFSLCAEGDRADCDATVTCRRAAPHCEGPYVISYVGFCYEGCVRADDCAP